MILIDTHVLLWLYAGELAHIPSRVRQRLNAEQIGLSPFVELEVAYLYEIGRVKSPASIVVDELRTRVELVSADVGAAAVCGAAIKLSWTRDPFDRLLAAHATVAGLPLVTRDETIRRHLPLAWWAA